MFQVFSSANYIVLLVDPKKKTSCFLSNHNLAFVRVEAFPFMFSMNYFCLYIKLSFEDGNKQYPSALDI